MVPVLVEFHSVHVLFDVVGQVLEGGLGDTQSCMDRPNQDIVPEERYRHLMALSTMR